MIDAIKNLCITLCYAFGCYIILLAVPILYNYTIKIINNENTIKENTVKENFIKSDSIIKVNDSIKIKVEHLDSIKNAKVIEVQTLDNDSTLKLFYKLVSE